MDTNAQIYRFLDIIANTVGNTITEYHWREACELMKLMEDEGLVGVVANEIKLKTYDKVSNEEQSIKRRTKQ